MNLRQYLRLMDRQTTMTAGFGLIFGVIMAVNLSKDAGSTPQLIVFGLFFPLLCIAVGLAGPIQTCEIRPGCVLLPGLRQSVRRWSAGLSLGAAFVWGAVVHLSSPGVPWLLAATISGVLLTLVLAEYQRRMPRLAVPVLTICTVVIVLLRPDAIWAELERFVIAHHEFFSVACALLSAFQLKLATDPQRLRRKEIPFAESARRTAAGADKGITRLLGRGPSHDYGMRRVSVGAWVTAVQQERPGFGYLSGMVLAGVALLLACPLQKESGGYPLAWYRMVYLWSEGPGAMLAVMLWIALIAAGLFVPLPRRDVLYPIARVQRAQVAFWSSAGAWLTMLAVWIGSALLMGTLAGWWLGLPMSAGAFVRFAAPAAMSLPTLALLRWAALNFEGRSNTAMWAVCLISIPVTIAGWVTLANMSPTTSLAFAAAGGTVSLVAYYIALRCFYTCEDLIQPMPAKPSFRIR